MVLALAVTGAAALLVVDWRHGTPSMPQATPPLRAPSFVLPEVRDAAVTVGLPAGQPVVVNFFASWCTPCKREAPLLRKAAAEHGGEVAFIGVDHQDQRDDAKAFLAKYDLSYPVGYDPGGETAPRYRVPALPATAFVRADGSIAAVVYGELKPQVLASRLRELTLHARQG